MSDKNRRKRRSNYLKETSDRSGFDNFSYDSKTWTKKWTSVDQGGLTLEPEEYDMPPPSSKPLGGEGDITNNARSNSDFATANASTANTPILSQIITVQYLTSSSTIQLLDQPWIQVSGSNASVNLASSPQLALGRQGQSLSLECVGSGVILEHGSGLSLTASRAYNMDSGSIINFFYSATDNLWHETSRSHRFYSLGAL